MEAPIWNSNILILLFEIKLLVRLDIFRKFHLLVQLSYTKISYLYENTHLRKDATFLHFHLE